MEKTAVAGAKDRAANRVAGHVVPSADGPTLQSFVRVHAGEDAVICTDKHGACTGLGAGFDRKAINCSVGEYVRGMSRARGVESVWSMLNRVQS